MTTSESSETTEARKARAAPGAGFPIVSLPETVAYVKEASKYGMEHSRDAFAGYTKSKTAGSGRFKQKVGALRDFGLITTKGGRVHLTDLAKSLAFPTDPTQVVAATREAFDRCAIFVSMYDRLAKGTPLDADVIGNSAVANLKVSPRTRTAFANSFVDSAVAAGLATKTGDGQVLLGVPIGHPAATEPPTPSNEQTEVEHSGIPGGRHQPARRLDGHSELRVVLSQAWPIDDGEMTLEVRSASALPATAFAELTAIITSLEQLARKLQGCLNDNTVTK